MRISDIILLWVSLYNDDDDDDKEDDTLSDNVDPLGNNLLMHRVH